MFAIVPDGIFAALIGFGFGLLARSMGSGITFSLAFLYVLSGVFSFIPGLKDYSYNQASTDFTSHLSGSGATVHNAGVALLIVVAWIAIIVVPGWLVFLRADLK